MQEPAFGMRMWIHCAEQCWTVTTRYTVYIVYLQLVRAALHYEIQSVGFDRGKCVPDRMAHFSFHPMSWPVPSLYSTEYSSTVLVTIPAPVLCTIRLWAYSVRKGASAETSNSFIKSLIGWNFCFHSREVLNRPSPTGLLACRNLLDSLESLEGGSLDLGASQGLEATFLIKRPCAWPGYA